MKKSQHKLHIDVLTIFPEMIESYCAVSILGRAQKAGRLNIAAHNLRNWARDKHGHVDDKPFGGGPGMVMQVEPFYRALIALKVGSRQSAVGSRSKKVLNETSLSRSRKKLKTRVILTSAKGKIFTQKEAKRLAKYDRLVFLCGRYEGVDERVAKHLAHEELSIGPYVLTGGELPSLVMIDAIARLRPGVLGKRESLAEESWSDPALMEYPQYTRPEDFNGWKVPSVLLSGNHANVEVWRKKQMKQC